MEIACDPATGMCNDKPSLGGSECDDQDRCTISDQCDGFGECQGQAKDCDDSNACTEDRCTPTNGECLHSAILPMTDGCCATVMDCDDGSNCTKDECGADFRCTNVPLGPTVRGCCVLPTDCDDSDSCTVEYCDQHFACVREGEKPLGTGVPACLIDSEEKASQCDAKTGKCLDSDLSRPTNLIVWDLIAGGETPGMVHVGGPDVRDASGMRPASNQSIVMRLPEHYEISSVKVLSLDLEPGASCNDTGVTILVRGLAPEETGCMLRNGLVSLAAAWQDTTNSRTDVTVALAAGHGLRRLTYQLWASKGIVPLQDKKLGSGNALFQSAMATDHGKLLAAYTSGILVSAIGSDAAGNVMDTADMYHFVTKSPTQIDYTSSMVQMSKDRFLFVFGGIMPVVGSSGVDEVRLVLLDGSGQLIEQQVLETTTGLARQTEPRLFQGQDGRTWVTWARHDGSTTNYNVMVREITVTDDQIEFANQTRQVNMAASGSTPQPVGWMGSMGGPIFWYFSVNGLQTMLARWLNTDGIPQGSTLVVDSSPGTEVLNPTLLKHQERYYLVWRPKNAQNLRGAVLDLNMQVLKRFDVPNNNSIPPSDFSLLALADGAALVYSQVEICPDTSYKLVIYSHTIGPDGVVSAGKALRELDGKIVLAMQTAPWTPFVATYVYNNHAVNPYQMVQGFLSDRCDQGVVRCGARGNNGVCIGFGTTGYLTLPDATAWCN